MDNVVRFGWLIIPFGVGIAIYFGHRWWTSDPNAVLVKEWLAHYRTWEELLADWDKPLQTLDEVVAKATPASMDVQLEEASPDQGVTLIGTEERSFDATVNMQPQTQDSKSSPWRPKNEGPSRALKLGIEWIIKVPKGERLPRAWLKGVAISQRSLRLLTDYLMGTKENPGPARTFNRQGQEGTPVYFMGCDLPIDEFENLPDDFGSIRFRLLDLGAFRITTSGECHELMTGDLVFSITAREEGGAQRWLVYLDARDEFARGSGIVMLLKPFNPDVEISRLL